MARHEFWNAGAIEFMQGCDILKNRFGVLYHTVD